MRLSSVFESVFQARVLPAEPSAADEGLRTFPLLPEPAEVPDDLDQRVRQAGEWQMEDW